MSGPFPSLLRILDSHGDVLATLSKTMAPGESAALDVAAIPLVAADRSGEELFDAGGSFPGRQAALAFATGLPKPWVHGGAASAADEDQRVAARLVASVVFASKAVDIGERRPWRQVAIELLRKAGWSHAKGPLPPRMPQLAFSKGRFELSGCEEAVAAARAANQACWPLFPFAARGESLSFSPDAAAGSACAARLLSASWVARWVADLGPSCHAVAERLGTGVDSVADRMWMDEGSPFEAAGGDEAFGFSAWAPGQALGEAFGRWRGPGAGLRSELGVGLSSAMAMLHWREEGMARLGSDTLEGLARAGAGRQVCEMLERRLGRLGADGGGEAPVVARAQAALAAAQAIEMRKMDSGPGDDPAKPRQPRSSL